MNKSNVGRLLYRGKTKDICQLKGSPDSLVLRNRPEITAFNDPKFTREFASKAISATTTTCYIFSLLKQAGIPVGFIEQISPTEFTTPLVKMLPIEMIARRYPVGSFLDRRPDLRQPPGVLPECFHRLIVEFFLKTGDGMITGTSIKIPQINSKKKEDPLIFNPYESLWTLCHPKKPTWEKGSTLCTFGPVQWKLGGITPSLLAQIEEMTRRVFLVLEGAWNTLGLRLIDFKIEFGLDANGNLVVADVIDNDSWRLRDAQWQELSKQAFRDGEELGAVEKKYALVAELSKRLRIPRQALLIWRGSDKDSVLGNVSLPKSVSPVQIIVSGHKSPQVTLDELEAVQAQYPDGGVIISAVGMSNGLGPILAARTTWPVIALPLTVDQHPEDVWSSLRMPSRVPLMTVCNPKNAVLAALNILAASNPEVYGSQRYDVECLDVK